MDIFDDIVEVSAIESNYPLLRLLEKKLPQCTIQIISESGGRIPSKIAQTIDKALEMALWKKAKQSKDFIFRKNENNFLICAWYLQNIKCLLICSLPDRFDPFITENMIPNVVTLCAELFYKDLLLAEGKEQLLIHKKQRDRKIQVLEKKYEDILVTNQKQSAEYSKLLQSEIKRQTSELKNSNKALKLAKKKAEAANLAKDAFLANMSHEIRTPMSSVLGFLELTLEDPTIRGDLQQYLSTAHNSAQGLLSLIDDILHVSKLEGGKVVLEKRPFRLLELIKKSCDTMKIEAQKKGLYLEYDIHPSLPGSFLGDAFRINQVLVNLIGNAIKFTQHGGVVIKIMPEKKKKEVHFMVEDSGIGILPDRLNKLFDPFEQADMSTTRKYGGTGLGTTISKQIVELMGGQIWAESEKDKGSIFHFIINIDACDDNAVEDIDRFKEKEKSGQNINRKFKILLAEDTDTNAILVKTRLERQGHHITHAHNGREAVDAFKKNVFDIVLMDIHMPEMDGIQATAIIRSTKMDTREHIPIIALTASVMGTEIKRFIAAGMDSVVAKPIDFKKLNMAMDKLVPEDKGVKNSKNTESGNSSCRSKEPRIDGVDYKAGIARWQDQEIYTKALISFADEYKNILSSFSSLLDSEQAEQAYQVIHKLKGTAANLSIIKVADIAGTINSALKKKNIKSVKKQFIFLETELNSVIVSILKLRKKKEPDGILKKIEPDRIGRLIKKMMSAFNQYSPQALNPLMKELENYIHRDQLIPILKNLDDLDFDAAKNEFIKLAESLHLD